MTAKTPKELKPGTNAERFLLLDVDSRSAIDVEARTVELAFASETPVDRHYGQEILDLGAKSIRMDRLKRGGPLLMDHRYDDQVGVIETVQIGKDRVARAVVRFGKSARASEMFQDVVDGIRTNVSVSYRIHAAVLEAQKDGQDVYRITDWEPYEISMVSVPADIAVGVGRSADAVEQPAAQTPTPEPLVEIRTMSDIKPTPAPEDAAAISAAQSRGTEAERKRVSDISAIGDQYAKYGVDKIAGEAIRAGMSVSEFRAKAMDTMSMAPSPNADVGMSDKDIKQYSLMRALNYLANPGDRRAREAAGYEIELSQAAAERSGKTSQGLMVPFDVLNRGMTKGVAADGGNLVATDLMSANFIELLRNAMVIDSMGAQYLTGLVGNIAIPKQSGAGTAYWVTEGSAPTTSTQAIAQVAMAPKTVGAFTDISRKLMLQSSIDVEQFVQNDLARVLGLAIQSVAIKGGGSNEPTGILATAGIGNVAGGTNGLAPTWQNIIDLETNVAIANADIGTLAYLTNAKVRGKLKSTSKVSGQNGFLWDNGNTPLNGYRTGVTNAVPSNLTKGTSTSVASAIIFGNFADLIIGMWGGLDLVVDPYSNSTSGTVRVVALQDVDVAVRHAESFSAMLDALTA